MFKQQKAKKKPLLRLILSSGNLLSVHKENEQIRELATVLSVFGETLRYYEYVYRLSPDRKAGFAPQVLYCSKLSVYMAPDLSKSRLLFFHLLPTSNNFTNNTYVHIL